MRSGSTGSSAAGVPMIRPLMRRDARWYGHNILRPRQNNHRFAHNVLKYLLMNKIIDTLIENVTEVCFQRFN